MSRRKYPPPSAVSCIKTPNGDVIHLTRYTVGVGFEDLNEATPEELDYIHRRIQYNALMGQVKHYARMGIKLVPSDPSLLIEPEPVGRFIPRDQNQGKETE